MSEPEKLKRLQLSHSVRHELFKQNKRKVQVQDRKLSVRKDDTNVLLD